MICALRTCRIVYSTDAADRLQPLGFTFDERWSENLLGEKIGEAQYWKRMGQVTLEVPGLEALCDLALVVGTVEVTVSAAGAIEILICDEKRRKYA